jgi:hypothetical protein
VLNVEIQHAGPELRELALRLKRSGDPVRMRKQLLKGLKDGVKPAVSQARSAALTLPSSGKYSTGFRRKLARSITTQVRTSGKDAGVRVRVSKARMGRQASLVTATNKGRWRHPVFGDRNVWVTQHSRAGWFDQANRYSGPPVRRALKKVLDDMEKELGQHL